MARLAGPPPRATRAAAPVEERERDAVLGGTPRRSRFLRLVERPVGREEAAVLVAVGVAEHHLCTSAAQAQVRAVGASCEQRAQDPRRRVEVVERLEERHDRQAPGRSRPTAPSSSTVSRSAGAARHRDDERPERLGAIKAPHAREQPKEPPGLGARLAAGPPPRRGRPPRAARPASRRRAARRGRRRRAQRRPRRGRGRSEDAAERAARRPGVLAQVEPRGVQAEGLELRRAPCRRSSATSSRGMAAAIRSSKLL